jgi:hypothetical protein
VDEILINTSTTGDQSQPSVAAFRGTQFVAVWPDGGSGNIKGQIFGADGGKTSSEFVVNFPAEPGTRRHLATIIEYGLV